MLRTDSPADDYARYSRDVLEPAEHRQDLIDEIAAAIADALDEWPTPLSIDDLVNEIAETVADAKIAADAKAREIEDAR